MKRRIILLIMCLMCMAVCACGGQDDPPPADTPEPAALDGEYKNEKGKFTFNGDGQSIIIDIDEELAKESGLPAGKSEGTYVFLFGGGKYRRDKAETFRIRIDEKDYTFRNNPGVTGEIVICVFFGEGDATVFRLNQKKKAEDAEGE